MKKRVWKYCRQASPDEGLTGLRIQSHHIDSYIAQNGLSLVGETKVVEKGITLDRKSLHEIVRLAEDGAYDILLVSSFDRLARDMWSMMDFCRNLSALGIRIIAIRDQSEITEEGFRLQAAILQMTRA